MRKVGIWIDQKEANIITLTKKDVHCKTIYSDIETRIRLEGEKKQYGRFGDQYLVDEKGKKKPNQRIHPKVPEPGSERVIES